MNKEKGRVPKLRFPGFTEDWEQCKLDDIAKIKTGGGTPKTAKPEYWSGNIPWIQSSDLVEGDITHVNINKFINNNALKNSAAKLISRDSIALVTRVGVGKVAVINQDFTTSQDFLSLSDFDRSDIKFLAYQLYRLMQENAKVLQGTSLKGITKTELIEQSISIPNSGQEQHLISNVLSKIDSLITLHQRKLEHLNLKKKALLQKLFPKDGERYPELRFPGFTDAWEQCKLNEFLSVSDLKNTEDKYNKKDVLSVSGDYGIVNQIEFQGRSFAGVSVSNYGVVETGDIVYTKSPLKLNPYGIIKTNRINNGIVSTLYAIYKTKENCDSKFIEHYFNLDSRLNKYLKPLVNKGAKNDMKVSSENALIGEVCFPHITEQKLIADFLDWLDVYITLHQRKLEHLQLQKKALLQQMFV